MDAALVSAWKDVCQQLAPAFTAPTLVTFLHLAAGWVLCRSRPAVTSLVLTVGEKLLGHAARHRVTYERFFHRAAWSLDDVSRPLLVRVVMPLVDEWGARDGGGGPPPVGLNVDDTTAARYGRHVAWAGYFKDASASNVLAKACHWSHNWVLGCVHFRCRLWPDWVILGDRPARVVRPVPQARGLRPDGQGPPVPHPPRTGGGDAGGDAGGRAGAGRSRSRPTGSTRRGCCAGCWTGRPARTWSAASDPTRPCTPCPRPAGPPAGGAGCRRRAGGCPRRGSWPPAGRRGGGRSRCRRTAGG
jgi:hypothetical protein